MSSSSENIERLARRLLQRHGRFFSLHVLTGVLTVIVHYFIFYLLLKLGCKDIIASMSGFTGGAILKFFSSYHIIFRPHRSMMHTSWRFLIAIAAQALLNFLLFKLLISLHPSPWFAQISTTIVLTFLNYLVYRYWVF